MKRTSALGYFVIFFVTIISLSVFPLKEHFHANALSKADLAETQTAALVQVWNLLRFSFPTTDYAGGLAFKANLTPLVGQVFIHIKQISSAWQRSPIVKQTKYISGFFFAAMIIALFYCFYRSFGSSTDGDNNFSINKSKLSKIQS